MPQGMTSLWIPRPSRGMLQAPGQLNIEPPRLNGYIYNGSTYTLTLTNQNQWYNFTFDTQVPANFQSNVTLFTPTNGMTVASGGAGWTFIHYTIPADTMSSADTYESAVFVNGVQIDSGGDSVSGLTGYTFGANTSGVATAGMRTMAYANLAVGDTIEVKARCTTSAGKSLRVVLNQSAFNPMSYTYALYPWSVLLANQNCVANVASPGTIVVPQTDLYYVSRNMPATFCYTRTTKGLQRRLYYRNPDVIELESGTIVDVVTFKQNPDSGSTTPPWSVNAAYNLEVKSARSSGL